MQHYHQVWVSVITYIAALEGWLYLAIILDLFSRQVVGWKLAETLEVDTHHFGLLEGQQAFDESFYPHALEKRNSSLSTT